MHQITDWLMVGITAVYVVATIFICKANYKSANASKKQLEEMREQYKKNNRPRIEVEFIYEKRCFYGLRFVNHGNQTAQQVSIDFDDSFINSIEETHFLDLLKKQKDKECVIGVGQHHDIYIGSNELRNNNKEVIATGKIIYFYGDEKYEENLYVDVKNYMTMYSVNSEHEDLIKKLKEQNEVLTKQNNSLITINNSLQKIISGFKQDTNKDNNKQNNEIT